MENQLTEKIGGVTLDLSKYSGEDLYCDGTVEDEILEIVKNHRPEEYDSIILEKKSWPVLYHLSGVRENIVGWIPFTGTEKVLEIGAGPGAVTGILSERCASVTCVELSKKRSLINAWRHKDRGNITIKVGNFEDIEPELDTDYDYIFLIGVLEYAESYLTKAENSAQGAPFDPFREELQRVRRHLKSGDGRERACGRVVIAIENRLGLKYFAGCREDHSGRYFDGIESYMNTPASPATTFSRPMLERLLQETGFPEYSFYYPYPDYKFPDTVYSDRRLPDYAELSRNIRNFDRDRLLLFDERKAYRGITADGLYPLFANSFEIVTGPELPVSYCRFSGERDRSYRIRTMLAFEADGWGNPIPVICKYPLVQEAQAHVARLPESGRKLAARYETGTGLHIAPCWQTADGQGAAFSFIPGRTLEEVLDGKLEEKDREGILALFDAYMQRVGGNPEVAVSDYDMTFSNLMLSGDDWTAIDYEWEVDSSIPAKELLFRSILCWIREDPSREERLYALIPERELLARYGVTEEDRERLTKEEDSFQERIAQGSLPLGKVRSVIGGAVIKPAELQTDEERDAGRRAAEEKAKREERARLEKEQALIRLKVYFDTGKGYNEEEAVVPEELYGAEGCVTFTVRAAADVARLRVDPASVPCIVLLRRADLNGKDALALFDRYRRVNGTEGAGGTILYATEDPWFDFDLARIRRKAGAGRSGGDDELTFTIQMAGIPGTMSQSIVRSHR